MTHLSCRVQKSEAIWTMHNMTCCHLDIECTVIVKGDNAIPIPDRLPLSLITVTFCSHLHVLMSYYLTTRIIQSEHITWRQAAQRSPLLRSAVESRYTRCCSLLISGYTSLYLKIFFFGSQTSVTPDKPLTAGRISDI